ncbi:MAG TPA: hypothetical protein VM580_11500, partial [Labilithrix sp.]|nr:hypothetical protein [Labilithrix sp.]
TFEGNGPKSELSLQGLGPPVSGRCGEMTRAFFKSFPWFRAQKAYIAHLTYASSGGLFVLVGRYCRALLPISGSRRRICAPRGALELESLEGESLEG